MAMQAQTRPRGTSQNATEPHKFWLKNKKKWHLLNDERKNCRKPRNNGACFVEEPDASSHPPCTTCSFQGVHRQHPAQNAVEV